MQFIVKEVRSRFSAEVQDIRASYKFEHMITNGIKEGYRLHSWQFANFVDDEKAICETIVAVFERIN